MAQKLKQEVEEKLNVSKSFINYMSPIVGSRVGLGAQIISIIADVEPETA